MNVLVKVLSPVYALFGNITSVTPNKENVTNSRIKNFKADTFFGLFSFPCQEKAASLHERAVTVINQDDIAGCAYEYVSHRGFKSIMWVEFLGTLWMWGMSSIMQSSGNTEEPVSRYYFRMSLYTCMILLSAVTFRNQDKMLKVNSLLKSKLRKALPSEDFSEISTLKNNTKDIEKLMRILKKNHISLKTLIDRMSSW